MEVVPQGLGRKPRTAKQSPQNTRLRAKASGFAPKRTTWLDRRPFPRQVKCVSIPGLVSATPRSSCRAIGGSWGWSPRLLTVAEPNRETSSFSKEIEQKVKELPQWMGGKVLLAVLGASGKAESMRRRLSSRNNFWTLRLVLSRCMPDGSWPRSWRISFPQPISWSVSMNANSRTILLSPPPLHHVADRSAGRPLSAGRTNQGGTRLVLKQSGQRDFSMYSTDSAAGQKALELGETAEAVAGPRRRRRCGPAL